MDEAKLLPPFKKKRSDAVPMKRNSMGEITYQLNCFQLDI
jgi:hypothetical protein